MSPDPTAVVLAVDLDGTICFGGRRPGPETSAVLDQFVSQPEHRLVVATSRSPRAVRRVLADTVTPSDLVCCNGALVSHRSGRVHTRPLDPELVEELVGELGARGIAMCLDYGDWFAASDRLALPWMGDHGRFQLTEWSPRQGVVKVCVAHHEQLHTVIGAIGTGLATCYVHEPRGDLDIVPAGTSKAHGLALLLGEERPLVVAAGNDTNDVALLRSADHAVIVGTSLTEVDRDRDDVRRAAPDDASVATALSLALADAGAHASSHLPAGWGAQ